MYERNLSNNEDPLPDGERKCFEQQDTPDREEDHAQLSILRDDALRTG